MLCTRPGPHKSFVRIILIRLTEPTTLMNLRWIKLFLAALWLIPGFGLLALEWSGGQFVGFTLAGKSVPLAWVFLALGAFNLFSWWIIPPVSARRHIRQQARQRRPAVEHDPNFDFEARE